MMLGNWLVTIDRETGTATTEFVESADEAWQRSLDLENANPKLFSTVIRRVAPR